MQEIINSLIEKAGLTAEQAHKALETIKDFVKEKFPMMEGAVNNLFGTVEEGTVAAASAVVDPSAPVAVAEESILDKISDVIDGDTGQKVEDFAKAAASKASEVFDDVKEKLGNLFGDTKKA